MASPRIAFVLGTRPEIIKMAPLIRECGERDISFTLIHTGQHYSDSLDSVFFDQLELPAPDYNLEVGSNSHGEQTAEMLAKIEGILLEEHPECVLVQGDTNSTFAGALATSKLDIQLGHIEAGLRSFDREMPEETNRVLTDHASDYLFPPTEEAKRLLAEEGITGNHVVVTGNTIVDSVSQNIELAKEKSTVLEQNDLTEDGFCLLTAHRAENVDSQETFAGILEGVDRFGTRCDYDVIYPIHPRARQNLNQYGLSVPDSIRLTDPLDFLDFIYLEDSARLIFTDSGGVQEEACILQTPCVTLRENTERPETVTVGSNQLVGTDPNEIVDGAKSMMDQPQEWRNPFGEGGTAAKILDKLIK